jgi:molecular chaperone GrpE
VNSAPPPPSDESKEPHVRVIDRRWWARGETGNAPDEPAARKPTVIEDLERRLADTTAQLQHVLTEHRRSLEEFEQVKARIRRDIGREVDRGRRAVLAELLDVLDNLDRAIAAAEDSPSPPDSGVERLARGVVLVRDQFRSKLEALGVTRIDAVGQPFDASRHDAVSMAPVEEEVRDGTVIAVAKEGYAIGDDLLRPASVIVGRYQAPSSGG